MSEFLSSVPLYLLLPIVIVLFFAIFNDSKEKQGLVFDNHKWSLYDALICVLILDCAFIILIQFGENTLAWLVVFCVLTAFSFFFVFKLKLKQKLSVLGLSKKGSLCKVLYGVKIQLIVWLLLFAGTVLFSEPGSMFRVSFEPYYIWPFYHDNLYAIGVLLIIFILFVPIVEEFIFRGLMYSPFRKKVGKWGAIFLTSILFALYHRQVIGVNGIVWAYMYEKKRSLIPSISAHIFNDICLLANFIYITDLFDIGYKVNSIGYAKTMFLICVLILIFILCIERWFLSKQSDSDALC